MLLPGRRLPGLLGRLCDRSAAGAALLVYGEEGTGEEVVAKAVYRLSRRRDGPFARSPAPVASVICAANTDTLLKNELFGRRKGVFTDANRDAHALFIQSHRGKLFFDAISNMHDCTPRKITSVLIGSPRTANSAHGR